MEIYITSLINLERCVRNSDTLTKFVNYVFFTTFSVSISLYFYCTCIAKYTGKIVHKIMCIFIHSLFYILNFMSRVCGRNFFEVACPKNRDEQACCRCLKL